MDLHVRWLALSATLTLACTASTEAPAIADDPDTAGGKADGFDEDLCPADVDINAGEGSQRRCYDPDNDAPISHPGDESLNGHWTLRIEDTQAGTEGVLAGWTLRFSSRFD